MEIKAQARSIRVSPRKVRLVADSIRKLSVDEALRTLTIIKKRGAYALEKTLRSAISNANNKDIKADALFIKTIDVLEGPAFKRFHPSTRGRVHPYKKRTSHILVTLSEKVSTEIKSKDTKAEKSTVKPELKIENEDPNVATSDVKAMAGKQKSKINKKETKEDK